MREAGLFGNSYEIRDPLSKKVFDFSNTCVEVVRLRCRKNRTLFRNHANVGNDSGMIAWLNATNGINSCKPNS